MLVLYVHHTRTHLAIQEIDLDATYCLYARSRSRSKRSRQYATQSSRRRGVAP